MKSANLFASIPEFLSAWMHDRKLRNPRTSLNASAAYLKMAPSMLSQVISGKRNISVKQANHIGERLRLTLKEKKHLELLAEHALNEHNQTEISALLRVSALESQRSRPHEELFQHFSQWYSLPILVLCSQPDLCISPEEIAERLAIDLSLVLESLERMERIGILNRNPETGMLNRTGTEILFSTEGKSEALREFHKQMLNRTASSIDKTAIEERYIGTETFRFSKKKMPAARAIIDHCLDSLLALEKESMTEDESSLYHAGVQLFKLAEFPNRASRKEAV